MSFVNQNDNLKEMTMPYHMTETERAERAHLKTLHCAVRGDRSRGDRYRCLAWGFIRGFKYRRIERTHHMQALTGDFGSLARLGEPFVLIDGVWHYEHNTPSAKRLHSLLVQHQPSVTEAEVRTWLADRTGAIPVPAPRAKTHTILRIEAGAGGVEANDWAAMLMKMYIRLCERKAWAATVLESVVGCAGIGITRACIGIDGDGAMDRLRHEAGIHRLVRVSQFSGGTRQTSFARVTVLADLEPRARVGASVVRNYILSPYVQITDVRTGSATADADAVFDGDLDAFGGDVGCAIDDAAVHLEQTWGAGAAALDRPDVQEFLRDMRGGLTE